MCIAWPGCAHDDNVIVTAPANQPPRHAAAPWPQPGSANAASVRLTVCPVPFWALALQPSSSIRCTREPWLFCIAIGTLSETSSGRRAAGRGPDGARACTAERVGGGQGAAPVRRCGWRCCRCAGLPGRRSPWSACPRPAGRWARAAPHAKRSRRRPSGTRYLSGAGAPHLGLAPADLGVQRAEGLVVQHGHGGKGKSGREGGRPPTAQRSTKGTCRAHG